MSIFYFDYSFHLNNWIDKLTSLIPMGLVQIVQFEYSTAVLKLQAFPLEHHLNQFLRTTGNIQNNNQISGFNSGTLLKFPIRELIKIKEKIKSNDNNKKNQKLEP